MLFTTPVLMLRLTIPGLWMWQQGLLYTWFRICWKDWWLLYRCTPCTYKSFRYKRSTCICNINRKREWYKTLVFQYNFPRTARNFLCMAWKSSIKSDRQRLDAVYPIIFIFIPMEYWSQLLWTENLLVFMQLYDKKLQRNWDDDKCDQYQLLCDEIATLCWQRICWL